MAREILARRGEILFARAQILCEGMTEEQIIPAMFEAFSGGDSLFMLGICCVSVGGKGYSVRPVRPKNVREHFLF